MGDNARTLIYVAVAILAVVAAREPWREGPQSSVPAEQGMLLFGGFDDPRAAKSLEVVEYDESNASVKPFQVSQVGGLWSIPSHENYPADAREHMAEAASNLIGLEVLRVASKTRADHETFGVVDPTTVKSVGETGVGTRVTIKDKDGKPLADVIVGKAVKDRPGLRYIRQPRRDAVYVVALKPEKFTTRFDDWIEEDLLKLNTLDIRQVELRDYSIQLGTTPEGQIGLGHDPRSDIKLDYDDKVTENGGWKLVKLTTFVKEKPVVGKMLPDEELNVQKLNDLKSALDDLKIVDVERKPKGLSGDLRASSEFVKNNEAVNSLVTRGFYPVPIDGKIEILSSEGEAVVSLADGVQYVLRFGNIAGVGKDKNDDKSADSAAAKDKTGPGVNRYLFVMARFNEDAIEKPKLEALPGEAAEAEAKPKPESGDRAAEKGKAKPPAKPDDKAKKPDAKAKNAEEQKRKAAQAENQKRLDEYNEKLKKGRDHAKELNDRFADWYYVISNDVYQKIHLARADIIKTKEKPAGQGNNVGDLKELEKGLGKEAEKD